MIRAEAKTEDSLSIAQMCKALGVSRIDYYRRPQEAGYSDAALELRKRFSR
jgi:predicted transcriptional regulator